MQEKSTSPIKRLGDAANNKLEDIKFNVFERRRIIFILENVLYFLFTQTILFVNQNNFTVKEKKNFKRDLLTEIVNNTFT